jgi:excisionase family DNA binding protein
METSTLKHCRTFPTRGEEPSSIATQIARHEGMLKPSALAILLAVSPKTVYAWVKAGTLPACILGASIRFDPFDTAEWVRARTE